MPRSEQSKERNRALSRLWKEQHRKTCKCGNTITYNAHHCHHCHALNQRTWNRDEVTSAIQTWAQTHGGVPPSAHHFASSKDPRYPNLSSVYGGKYAPFDTWSQAIRAAGFTPLSPGQRRNVYPDDLDQRKTTEIAKPFAHTDTKTAIVTPSDHRLTTVR